MKITGVQNLKTPSIISILLDQLVFNQSAVRCGSFGTMYKNSLYAGSSVAMKEFVLGRYSTNSIVKKMLAIKQINHENIVNIKGFCQDKDKILIILENFVGYDLDEILSHRYTKELFLLDFLLKHAITKQIC